MYRDPGNKISKAFVSSQMSKAAWDDIDCTLLDSLISTHVSRRGLGIDYGAGTGRLTGLLAGRFHSVIAYEPDDERFEILARELSAASWANVVATQTPPTLELGAAADFVLLSHVIQHLAPAGVRAAVSSTLSYAREGGILCLLAPTSATSGQFLVRCDGRDNSVASPISADEFDRCAEKGLGEGLPTRHYTRLALADIVRAGGWQEIEGDPYRPFWFDIEGDERQEAADTFIVAINPGWIAS